MLPISIPPNRRPITAFPRTTRTAAPIGPERLLFARDIIGPSAEIAAELYAHPAFREVTEVAFALPFTFDTEDYVQIRPAMATTHGPALGRAPRARPARPAVC